ncbi:CG5877 [Drosophila busckii]|uniref:CG5877 n=1 Tax=Drosophila busckii TaxID=30019 RepID=A0A0M5JDL8_DROBS|nr:uncharacterized protein LOC108605654 [Drosophila busckii]ALC48981.1 CG5877 [Drosophila busckii]
MSLFPAYGNAETKSATDEPKPEAKVAAAKSDDWKQNQSYDVATVSQQLSDSPSESESDAESTRSDESEKPSCSKFSGTPAPPQRTLEFDNTVEYYVDKSENRAHKELDRLPRLSRPNYRIHMRRLDVPQRGRQRMKREKRKLLCVKEKAAVEQKLSDEQTLKMEQRLLQLKQLVADKPEQLAHWVELHQLLGQNLHKCNRLAVAEQQLYGLETALQHHKGNEQLLQLYVATSSAAYADSEVASKLEQLLDRQPYEYTLWTALIMTTQGTMARCNVPAVLHIYEESMRRMHVGPKEQHVHTDELMLKLFHNCVLFLRQSANTGLMFALLRLSLELHATHVNFDCFEACAADETMLLEYEELVLRSGMPMPEIWTRVERLRQAYTFLPYPAHSAPGLDAERCVYAQDVCHYIYPLKRPKQNLLQLLMLVLQLCKLPLLRSNCLSERLSARIEQIGDTEAVEMLLANLFERHSFALPLNKQFVDAQLQLCKELYVCPSFMPQAIGHELYEQCLERLLLKCSDIYTSVEDEDKRQLFLLLHMRFERFRLLLLKLSGKLTPAYTKQARQRQRQLLRQPQNRQITALYIELAMFEFEAGEQQQQRIFEQLLTAEPTATTSVEQLQARLVYAEMLLAEHRNADALEVLRIDLDKSAQELAAALKQATLDVTATSAPLPLTHYFKPQLLLLLLRRHVLLLHLSEQTTQALTLLHKLLLEPLFAFEPTQLSITHCRHNREQLRELQLLLLELPGSHSLPQRVPQLMELLERALVEFPRNLTLLQRWSTLGTLPWFKLRARLVQTKAGVLSLLHLVLAARCRFLQHESEPHLQQLLRNRVLSMFETFLPSNTHRSEQEAQQYDILRRNSLFWRCYLRCLSSIETSFERSRSCLLMALDECPWDKALYMDGVTYVPQDIGSLQDVMTEKQLRIFALPEELSVLRES